MGKRGESSLSYFVSTNFVKIAVSAMIVVVLLLLVRAYANNSSTERQFLSRDTAMLIDAMLAAPGDVEYAYVLPSRRFDYKLGGGIVSVQDKRAGLSSEYFFAESERVAFVPLETESPPRELRFIKKGKELRVNAVYDDSEKEALKAFDQLVSFLRTNSKKSYTFKCRETFAFNAAIGYYISFSNGIASLIHQSSTGESQVASDRVPDLDVYNSAAKGFILASGWEPDSTAAIKMNGALSLVHESGTWHYSSSSIEVNQLPACELESLARKQ
ncbi:hypothetical protein HYY74_07800 [Candidatus Woesearchaeota archaeon]|nr:hypothetical protein [Candidatus Woesearchaeota archaeon]